MGMSPIKKKIPKMGRQLKWLERWFCTPEDRVPQSRQGFWMDAVPDSKHKVPEVKPRNFY